MAGTAGSIRAGRAFVEIFADTKKLMLGLKSSAQAVAAFGKSVNRLGKQMFSFGARTSAVFAGLGVGMGRIFSDLPEMQALNSAWERLATAFTTAVQPLAQSLIPAITNMVTRVTELVKVNHTLIQSFVKIGAVVGVAGVAITAAGAAMAALTSPIALVTAGLVGGAAAWVSFSDTGQQAWGVIVEAVSAGDLGSAFNALVGGMRKAWSDFALFSLSVWENLIANLQSYWVQFSTWMKSTLTKLQGATADLIIDAGFAVGLFSGDKEDVKRTRVENTNIKLGEINSIAAEKLKGIEAARESLMDNIGAAQADANQEFRRELTKIKAAIPAIAPAISAAGMAGAVATSQASRGLSSVGSFSAFDARGLGTQTLEKQQLAELKSQTKELKGIKKEVKDNKPKFT